jgi:D-serine dehydratase
VSLHLDRILATPITGDTVGAPAGASTTIGEVGRQGWTIQDLSPPIITLRRSAIEHNLDVMGRWTADHGVELWPHGKTTMAPQLWDRQLATGATGLTAATPAQVRAMRSVGAARILLANELVDTGSITWIARALDDPSWDFTCWVDSVDGVELLDHALTASSVSAPLPVLVEVGHEGGRTGARSVGTAIDVAEAVGRSPVLALRGVAGYEGTIGHERTAAVLDRVDRFLEAMDEVAAGVAERGLVDGGVTVSAGGSLFFDRVAARFAGGPDSDVRVMVRAGCTITHDHGLYERSSPLADTPDRLLPAIEAWGSVLSRPEPDVAVVGLGKRDVPSDIEPPIPLRAHGNDRSLDGMRVERLMDQHAICRIPPELSLAPGELVVFGISHPCTAFDRRRVLFVLDEDEHVIDAVGTLF